MTSRTTRRLRLAAALLASAALALSAPVPTPGNGRATGGFETAMGYSPETARMPDGTVRPVKPTGSCSAPTGATRYDFALACKAHDLGYDRLRYAAASGRPLGDDVRRAIDATLAHDLHAGCGERVACHALAGVYAAVAELNSWRQGYGPPVPEPAALWAGRAVIAGAVLTLLLHVAGSTRPSRSPTPHPR
jgi:hypothetical protein